jgi:molecular chaperone Hsp33
VAKALDLGVLSVIKDIGLKEPYVGQTQLVSGEIAEDLTYYYATSEQIPTSIALGVLMEKNNTVKQAGGFIIQLMPYASEELIDTLEKRLGEFTSITTLLDQGMEPLDIINQIFQGYDVAVTDTLPTKWHCNCSRERYYSAVMSLGRKEIASLLSEGEPIEVNCQFCNSSYTFSPEDLQEMLLSQK